MVENEDADVDVSTPHGQRAYARHMTMKRVNNLVQRNSDKAFQYSSRFHDRNLKGPYFSVGDMTYIMRHDPLKHQVRWDGPMPVIGKVDDLVYLMKLPNGEQKMVNVNHMKHFPNNKYSAAYISSLNPLAPSYAPISVQEQNVADIPLEEECGAHTVLQHQHEAENVETFAPASNSTPVQPNAEHGSGDGDMDDTFHDALEMLPSPQTSEIPSPDAQGIPSPVQSPENLGRRVVRAPEYLAAQHPARW